MAVQTENKHLQAAAWFNLGLEAREENDLPKARDCFIKALNLAEKAGDTELVRMVGSLISKLA